MKAIRGSSLGGAGGLQVTLLLFYLWKWFYKQRNVFLLVEKKTLIISLFYVKYAQEL